MHKQTHPTSCSLPPSNQDSNKKPSMACHDGAEDHLVPSAPADDFEFCILSSRGLAPAGDNDAFSDMCVADEVFSGGKLLPLRLSSADASSSAALLLLLRSDSLDGAATSTTTTSSGSGFSSRSVSRSSSSSVSRSTSPSSASSDHAGGPGSGSSSSSFSKQQSASSAVPPRRSLSGSGSVFYAHPSPSPRPPPSQRRSRTTAAAAPPSAARRSSTGSAPPASWGVLRLGVVGAPEVYAPRPAEYRKAAAARTGSRSARFDLQHRTESDKKLAAPPLGLLGAGLVCSCSPDAVAPVGSAEVAAAEARQRRKKKAEEKKRAASAKQSAKGTARRSRILEWLEDLSISKEKSAVSSCR